MRPDCLGSVCSVKV